MQQLIPEDRILALPSRMIIKNLRKRSGHNTALEYWLADIDISDVKAASAARGLIMSCDEKGSMNGSETSLNYFKKIGADGVLLNDIVMAINWIKFQ